MDFHFIIARKHGEAFAYPVITAFSAAGFLAVNDKYNELTGTGAGSFGAENVELLFASVDGDRLIVRGNHLWPDPAYVEKQRKAKALTAALALREANERAQKDVENAQALVSDTASKLQSLTSEQLVSLAEYDADQQRQADAHAQAEADKQAEQDLSAEARAESERLQKEAAEQSAGDATAALHETIVPARNASHSDAGGAPLPAPIPGPSLPLPSEQSALATAEPVQGKGG